MWKIRIISQWVWRYQAILVLLLITWKIPVVKFIFSTVTGWRPVTLLLNNYFTDFPRNLWKLKTCGSVRCKSFKCFTKYSFYSFSSTKRPFATIHSTILLLISLTADLKKYGRVPSKLNSYFHCTLSQTFRNYTLSCFTLILELSEG